MIQISIVAEYRRSVLVIGSYGLSVDDEGSFSFFLTVGSENFRCRSVYFSGIGKLGGKAETCIAFGNLYVVGVIVYGEGRRELVTVKNFERTVIVFVDCFYRNVLFIDTGYGESIFAELIAFFIKSVIDGYFCLRHFVPAEVVFDEGAYIAHTERVVATGKGEQYRYETYYSCNQ